MLTIRLQRVGRKNDPSFRVVVTDSKNAAKSGKFLEVVGAYDARSGKGKAQLAADRIKHWIAMGASLSDTVRNLLISKKVIEGAKSPVKIPAKVVAEAPAEAPAEAAPAPEVEKTEVAPVETPAEASPAEVAETEDTQTEVTEETPAPEVIAETPAAEVAEAEDTQAEAPVEAPKEEEASA
jgi:small subunit ribosomal protein S16